MVLRTRISTGAAPAVVDTELRQAHSAMVAEQRGVEDWKLSGDRGTGR